MRLRVRLLLVLLSSFWRRRLSSPLEESVMRLRVLPGDVDVRWVTNDRYLALMDLGRMDLAMRLGLGRVMVRRRWIPVVTATALRYRHHLALFRRYELRTRAVYWDEDTFYFQQRFVRRGRVVVTGYVCATLLGPDGPVRPAEVLAAAGRSAAPPPPPAMVPTLIELRSAIREEQAEREPAGG